MRFLNYILLFCAALFFFNEQSSAQTPVSNDQAVSFYKNCNATRDPRMRAETQDAFCACTAEKMMQAMSVEDVQTMGGNDQNARNALNKMLLDVYAPCMHYPVTDLIESQCIANEKIDMAGIKKPKDSICFCTGAKTAEWFSKEGRTLMRSIIMSDPNVYDPITPIIDSEAFKRQAYNNMMNCLAGN